MIGKNHPNWKGGKKSDRRQGLLIEYKLWRLAVFERDGFICQMPGCRKQEKLLNAHHIKKWSKYLELRYDINNGITLCKSCHNKTLQKEERFETMFMNIVELKNKMFKAP